MDFEIISTTEGAVVIENGTEKFLAINSGLKNKVFIGTDTSKLQSLPGLIIENNEIRNWKLEGITEINEITYFYGPYLEGKTFSELEVTPNVLRRLTEALHMIKDKRFPVRQFSLNSVFETVDKGILFFPPNLMDFLNMQRNRKNSLEMITPWNHPKLGGDEGRSFTIAALAYKSITEELPFPGSNEEVIERLIIEKNYKSPLLFEPLLNSEICKLIDDSFTGQGSLSLWRDLLKKWESAGVINKDLSTIEKKKIIESQAKKERKRIWKTKVVNFFQINKTKLIITLIVLITAGAILQTPISRHFTPPITVGMSQKEVVELYYNSIKNLDTTLLDFCITSKAGKNDINEVSTVYVTSKMRTSVEGTSGLIDPELWIADGKKPQLPGSQVWGLSDLKIKELSHNTFEATYTKWQPSFSDDIEDTTARLPTGTEVRDILHLTIIKEAWKIDTLNREF